MMCPALISEHVAAPGWNDRPATLGRALWRLHHTQRGEDLVQNPAETIMAPTECCIPCDMDLSVYRHGVGIILTGSCSLLFSLMQPPPELFCLKFVMQVWLLPGVERAGRFY